MSVAAVIGPVAKEQHGLAHLRQLREAGATKSAIEEAIRSGELERRLPEVYATAGAPRTWRQDVMAAVLDAGPDAAASHRTGAILLGVADRTAPKVVEITVPRRLYSRSPGVIVHRSLDLVADHVTTVDGIRCTGPLRTLVDLGAVELQLVPRRAQARIRSRDVSRRSRRAQAGIAGHIATRTGRGYRAVTCGS